MEGKHTQGPWHVGSGIAALLIYAPSGWPVASAEVYHGKIMREEAGRNARLLAAAPELLEALKDLLTVHECGADETGYVADVGFLDIDAIKERVRAVIAKAEGKEHQL